MADEPTIAQTEALTAALSKLNTERQKELFARKELARSAKLEYDRLQQEIALLEEQRKASQNMVITLGEIQQAAGGDREAAAAAVQVQIKALADVEVKSEEQKETLEALTKIQNEGTDAIHENIEALKDQNEQVLTSAKNLEELKKRSKDLGDTISETTGSALGLTGELGSKGLGGALGKGITQGIGFKDTLSAMKTSAIKLFNPMNIIGNVIANTIQRTLEFAEMQAELRQLTGAGDEMNTMFNASFNATKGLGVSTQELTGYWRSLETTFEGFNRLTQTQQVELTNLTAIMERFDISVQDTVDAQEFMQQSLQMTSTEAGKTQADMMALGKAIGRPPQIIMKDFKTAQNVIAQFGKSGFSVFKKLSAQAEATGVEMGSLIGIAEGFDTFESAADKVGSLNALLGGAYFDTMQMVGATEGERIELMREGISASGKSWESMGRFERKAIMAAAGITEINEANKLFGNSLDAYYEQEKAAAIASGSLSSLSAEAKKNLTPQEKLAAIMNQMTIAVQPLIDGLNILLDIFIKLTGALTSTTGQIVMGIALLVKYRGAIGFAAKGISSFGEKLGSAKNAVGGFFKTLVSSEGGLKKATKGLFKMKDVTEDLGDASKKVAKPGKSFAEIISAVGKAAQKSWKGILALGGAVLLIGAGIAAASFGMAELVRSFQVLTGEQILGALGALALVMGGFVGIMYAMAPAITALGAAGTAGAIGLVAVGSAFALIGKGIQWAASGLADIQRAFGETLATIAELGPDSAIFLEDLSEAIEDIMETIEDMDLAKLEKFYTTVSEGLEVASISFASVARSIDELDPDAVTWMRDMNIEIGKLSEKINTMDLNKLEKFYETVGAPQPNTSFWDFGGGGDTSISGITDSISDFFGLPDSPAQQNVAGVTTAKGGAAAARQASITKGIVGGIAGTAPAAPSPGAARISAAAPKQEVILEVDGYRLGKVVYESFLKGKLEPMLEST